MPCAQSILNTDANFNAVSALRGPWNALSPCQFILLRKVFASPTRRDLMNNLRCTSATVCVSKESHCLARFRLSYITKFHTVICNRIHCQIDDFSRTCENRSLSCRLSVFLTTQP